VHQSSRLKALALRTLAPLLALLVLFALTAPSAADTITGETDQFVRFADISFTNETRYESWVDVSSTVSKLDSWHIERAFCMKPHSSWEARFPFKVEQGNDIRVRAEIKLHGCANGTHKVVSAEHSISIGRQKFDVTIFEKGVSGHFGLVLQPK
jgi:hypothetical protein